MTQTSLIERAGAILSSLDAGESPRKIVDALVRDHGAFCDWQGGCWTLSMLGISIRAEAVNGTLLRSWCLKATSPGPVGLFNPAAAKALAQRHRPRVRESEDFARLVDKIGQDHGGFHPAPVLGRVPLYRRLIQSMLRQSGVESSGGNNER